MSYGDMAKELDCGTKKIDNTLQRVKKKLTAILESGRGKEEK
jgi:DNA-directed RNA polymerase specialized sigma24 family protein